MAQEPDSSLLHKPLLRYWLATRPAFFSASVIPAVVGALAAHEQGHALQWGLLLLTVLGIMLVHAGVNVLNDYFDEQNGTDRRNTQRIFPFTGGSRFIQNGVLTEHDTLMFGSVLMLVAMALGFALTAVSGVGLLWIGVLGFVVGWGYSAPPLRLNSRGLGEPMVALGFWILTPLGAWFVQTGSMAGYPVLVSFPLSLLIMNILLINQFPDSTADAASGKHHWVVRFGMDTAAKLYLAAVILALTFLLGLIILGLLPKAALLSALPLGIAIKAALQLMTFAHEPAKLEPAIKMTIGTAVSHGVLLGLGLVLG